MDSKSKKTPLSLASFEGKRIRRHWDESEEKWYFSVVDVVGILSGSVDGRNYWKVLKNRLTKEGSQVVTKCNQLKMQSSDGKYYLTDVADTETMFRLIQSIPSPNAEPQGRGDNWINLRLKNIEVRKDLTEIRACI